METITRNGYVTSPTNARQVCFGYYCLSIVTTCNENAGNTQWYMLTPVPALPCQKAIKSSSVKTFHRKKGSLGKVESFCQLLHSPPASCTE